ncbi:GatB/YqeY domain-containing protein [Ectothiorhodospira shaposhnikovii]|uniref:GatB/YqeY domain-containing protein n=1 Tax=Ectothiorhodospira shaposhnikovii TaxID=1054 RepID=UPI001EE9AEBA|nr:GatB/YqeY domain-containing protein [Ectothiorhodospira shaposhnikovii]MCG5513303.1 GatB/YqeY domain-containing protein [Ectothiorhodospira shaposhnikovii]
MTTSSLKSRITEDMKAAMRGGDKSRLGTVRLILAAIKQMEVDSRTELDDAQILAVLDKMVKQRRESISQYQQAGRDDLAQVEQAELEVIQAYLPQALTDDEIRQMIDAALAESGAESVRDMGKVMNLLKPRMQGRADMAAVSGMVKTRLS